MDKQIVISRYKENVEWLSEINIKDIILYNKGLENPYINNSNVVLKNIPNVGREAQTWTYHIINNWNNLANTTFFLQADPFDHTKDLNLRLSYDYEKPAPLTIRYKPGWPENDITQYDLVFKYNEVEIRMGNIKYYGHRSEEITREWFESIWNQVFDCPIPKHYYFGYGAMWAIPKDYIKNRSLAFWQNLDNKLQHNEEAYRKFDTWALEALWSAIFSKNYKCIIN
jgi:hypothetical protein